MTSPPLVRVRDARKIFDSPAGPFAALDGVDLNVKHGEHLAIVGRSGSGKSTLLNLIAGLDRPTSGEVAVQDTALHTLDETSLTRWRGQNVGVVFQFFQLLPTLTAVENVVLPMDFAGRSTPALRVRRALDLLERVGLKPQADKFPATLSGGERQRVAIARALANDPPLILADEPTGNLDSTTAAAVRQLFADLVGEGRTVIEVTHDSPDHHAFTRVVRLADGRVMTP